MKDILGTPVEVDILLKKVFGKFLTAKVL